MRAKKEHWPSYARRLRKGASEVIARGEFPDREVELAIGIPDAYSRAFALSSIFRELCDAGMDGNNIWEMALKSAADIEPEWKREEILERMASWGMKCGKDVNILPDMINDRELRMKLLSKLVRISDEKNMLNIWEKWSGRPEKDRYELLRMMVHNGFPGEMAVEMAGEISDERKEMMRKYVEGGGKPEKNGVRKEADVPALTGPEPAFTLALYNTYRGKASDIHFRSISRAAALSYAFDLKLALIGFPFSSEDECVERTISSTRIGDGSEYLKELHRSGRFSLHRDISELDGALVATTPNPSADKEMGLRELQEGMVFLMGLGHDGLPEKALKMAEYHLEFTGKRASLETCTAMGVLASMLYLRRKPYIVD